MAALAGGLDRSGRCASASTWCRGGTFIKAGAAADVVPARSHQDLAETSTAVTSTTSPSRTGFAIAKKRATTFELLWASIAA